jgi:ribonuclease P protein component
VLPASARLTHRDDFTAVVRHGRRAARRLVVMHVLSGEPGPGDDGPRVGLIVSKSVGGSVVRHRVARRLRHLMRSRLSDLPAGSRVVVRALPASATADSGALDHDLDRALRAVLSPRSGTGRSRADGSGTTAGRPGAGRPGADRSGAGRPEAARPEAARPEAARPAGRRP